MGTRCPANSTKRHCEAAEAAAVDQLYSGGPVGGLPNARQTLHSSSEERARPKTELPTTAQRQIVSKYRNAPVNKPKARKNSSSSGSHDSEELRRMKREQERNGGRPVAHQQSQPSSSSHRPQNNWRNQQAQLDEEPKQQRNNHYEPRGQGSRGTGGRGGNRGRGSRGGQRGGRPYDGHGYSDHEENSNDEDLERFNYQAMRNQNTNKRGRNVVDCFDSQLVQQERSRSRSLSPIDRHEKILPDDIADLDDKPKRARPGMMNEEINEVKPRDDSDRSDSSGTELSRILEESRLDQIKLLEQNAAAMSQPKKPKKGKNKHQEENHVKTLKDYAFGGRDGDDNPDVDMKTRITGTIIRNHQRENRRSKNGGQEGQGDAKKGDQGQGRKKLKIFKPKFIGLNAKFEYRNMIQAGKQMFTSSEVFANHTKNIGELQINEEGLQRVAGFGKLLESLAQETMEQMMRNFSLAIHYSNHYSNFANSRLD